MTYKIKIEPPRLDGYGRPIPNRFLYPVVVQDEGKPVEEILKRVKAKQKKEK